MILNTIMLPSIYMSATSTKYTNYKSCDLKNYNIGKLYEYKNVKKYICIYKLHVQTTSCCISLYFVNNLNHHYCLSLIIMLRKIIILNFFIIYTLQIEIQLYIIQISKYNKKKKYNINLIRNGLLLIIRIKI